MSNCCSHGNLILVGLQNLSFEKLLLSPRSALEIPSPCSWVGCTATTMPSFSKFQRLQVATMTGHQSPASAPSMFGASPFGRWVVTQSLADFNFHDHRPAVSMNQHLFVVSHERAVEHCTPMLGSSLIASSAYRKWPTWSCYFQSFALPDKTISVPAIPEGNFEGNQLLDVSTSLSPLYPSQTNDLHFSSATSFHQSFPWRHPSQA